MADLVKRLDGIFLCLAVCLSVCAGEDNYSENHSVGVATAFWSTIAGYAVIGVIILVICGLISLVSWLVCMCHEKVTKKQRVHQMALTSGTALAQAPDWAQRLVILPQLANQGFGTMSDGMCQVDPYHVSRQRRGNSESDGARWSVPLMKGKHLFEIIWAWGQRGQHSGVGLGTERAALKGKSGRTLVGKDAQSWGLDIVSRRVYHRNRVIGGQYPPDGSFVPDRFLMYVDMDNGKLGFGTDVTFWGFVVTGLNTNGSQPLYVLATTNKWQAGIRIYYKGSEDPDAPTDHSPPSNVMSSYAMPPPPGPAYPPAPAPPPYSYFEVVPSTSTGKTEPSAPAKPDGPTGSQGPPSTVLPPPYTDAGPPTY